MLDTSSAFLIYTKPRIKDWDAGGRGWSVGAYDGQNPVVKGGFGYVRSARATITTGGQQGYEDRSEFRTTLGKAITPSIAVGLQGRYVTKRIGPTESKFLQGDIGTIFPVFAGLRGGVTYENILFKEEELPPTLGGGLVYAFGSGITIMADGYHLMKGQRKGDRGWAAGGEISLAADFVLRAGRFQEGVRRLKGWSAGLSWNGPRASLDYSMKTTGSGPKERDHIFGLNLLF